MGNGWSSQEQRRIVVVTGTLYSGIFVYSGPPASGNLIVAITAAGGTDPYGNAYVGPGVTVGTNSGGQVVLGENAGAGFIYYPPTVANIATAANITQFAQGSGTAAQNFMALGGPIDATQLDGVNVALYQSSADATQPAQINHFYKDPTGVFHLLEFLNYSGVHINAGALTAVQPGTGTSSANPATGETWHPASSLLSALWTATGSSNPLRYRLEGTGGGVVRLDGFILTTGAGPWPGGGTILTLPAGYRPAAGHPFITRSDIDVTAGMDTVNVLAGGAIQNGQNFTAAGQRLFFDGITFPLD